MGRIKILIAFLACVASLPAQNILTGASRTGGGAAPSKPTVRCSSSGLWSTNTINFPSCATAGDMVFIFTGTPFSYPPRPVGWNDLTTTHGIQMNASVIEKVISSGDVSTGSVTFTNVFNPSVYAIVELVGGNFNVGTTASDQQTGSTATSANTPTNGPVNPPDLVLWWGSYNCASNVAPTINLGTTLQSPTFTIACGVVSAQTISSSTPTLTPTFGYTGGYFSPGYANLSVIVHTALTNTFLMELSTITCASTTCTASGSASPVTPGPNQPVFGTLHFASTHDLTVTLGGTTGSGTGDVEISCDLGATFFPLAQASCSLPTTTCTSTYLTPTCTGVTNLNKLEFHNTLSGTGAAGFNMSNVPSTSVTVNW